MSHDAPVIDDSGRAPVIADLVFWSVAGAAVAAGSDPLADSWAAPQSALVAVTAAVVVAGLTALRFLRALRPMPRRLVGVFGWANLAMTLLLLATAKLDWLHLSNSGNAALAVAAVIALVLGTWQIASFRRTAVS